MRERCACVLVCIYNLGINSILIGPFGNGGRQSQVEELEIATSRYLFLSRNEAPTQSSLTRSSAFRRVDARKLASARSFRGVTSG